jgi:hypothetical protein
MRQNCAWAVGAICLCLGLMGCAQAGAASVRATSSDSSRRVDVQAACDRLADVGVVIGEAQTASSSDEVAAVVRPALATFLQAADASGDSALAELAQQASDEFEGYLTGDDMAGGLVDTTLDAAASRCVAMGTSTSFPRQSSSGPSSQVCKSDRKTLETASEAYQAMYPGEPMSEQAFVEAGLIRHETTAFDVDDGGTVTATLGGGCD